MHARGKILAQHLRQALTLARRHPVAAATRSCSRPLLT